MTPVYERVLVAQQLQQCGPVYWLAMNYTVRVERVSATTIAVVRRRVAPGELSRVVPEACGLVFGTVKAVQVKVMGRQVAVYRSAGAGLIDIEVGVEVGSEFQGGGEVVGSVTPGGVTATVTHFGPYGRLGDAHAAVRQWCAANERIPAGPHWELYGHWLQAWNHDPSKIRTDIFYLLEN